MSRISSAVVLVVGLAFAIGLALADVPKAKEVRVKSRARHGSVTEGLDCGNCHTPAGWKMAGGKSGGGFDHSRTGFPLSGRHRSAACNQCHSGEREVRRQCASCHEDPHQARLGQQCESCHAAYAWEDTQALEIHRRTRFPLTGMHVLADCTECHQRTGERQWTAVPSACFACHAADYLDPTVHPNHRGTGASAPFSRDCSQCHRASAWTPAIADPTMLGQAASALRDRLSLPRDHDRNFPISFGPHRGATCTSCHTTPKVPRIVQCTGCHEHNPITLRKQHRRRVATSGSACLSCHPGGAAR